MRKFMYKAVLLIALIVVIINILLVSLILFKDQEDTQILPVYIDNPEEPCVMLIEENGDTSIFFTVQEAIDSASVNSKITINDCCLDGEKWVKKHEN